MKARLCFGALLLLLALSASAQQSQFAFDPSGSLLSEFTESSALPRIIGQPQMQIVIPGHNASFSVGVADTTGVSYQWYFTSSPILGATADSLLLTNVSSSNEGFYWVAVSNTVGFTASTLANLYIDSRGCGMADSWQLQYFGNLSQNAWGDYDGDGVSNLQEFLDGTNPTNAASALYRIALVNDGGTVTISPDQATYTSGQVVTLTATSTNSNPFHAWTGDVVTRSSSITLSMTNNLNLFAHFLPFTLVWTNLADGDWNDAPNWSPNLSPISNESVIIGYGFPGAALPTITENSNVDLVDFTFGNSSFIPELTGNGLITISGTGIWNSGTMSGTGTTVVQPGASLILANSSGLALNNRTLENAGSVVWVGGNFWLGGIITNDPGAQFQFLAPSSLYFSGGTPRFDNAGTLILATNPAATFLGVAFNDYGTVDFPGGTLTLAGGGLLASSLSVPADSALVCQAGIFTSTDNLSITGDGALWVSGLCALGGVINVTGSNVFSSGSIDFTGNYTCTNNTLTISGATVGFDGTGTVAPAVLNLTGGVLGGAQDVTVGATMSWTGGGMSGTGRTIIPSGATLSISNPSPGSLPITSRTLDNGGVALWTGPGGISLNDAVITNRPGALFNAQNAAAINFGGGAPRFDNAGTFRKTVSAGTLTLAGVSLANYGLVDIQSGVLFVDTGNFGSAPGAVLNCAIGGPIPATNYGQLQVIGPVALNGALSINLTNNYVPATNDSFTVLTAGSLSGAFSNFLYPSNVVTLQLGTTANSIEVVVAGAGPPDRVLLPPQFSGTNVTLCWGALPNVTYRVEVNSTLDPSTWLALPGDVTSSGRIACKSDVVVSSNRFYRIVIVP